MNSYYKQCPVTPNEVRGLLCVAGRKSRFLASLGMTVSMLCEMLLLGMLLASTAHAQIIGPGPKQGKVQFGAWWAFMQYDQLYRYMYEGQEWQLRRGESRDRAALVLRYGVTDAHYLIMNFGFLQKQYTDDEGDNHSSFEGVWGVGGGARILTHQRTDMVLRVSGEYNDVFWYENHVSTRPWRGRDARLVLAIDRTWNLKSASMTPAIGILGFSAREKEYDWGQLVREKNRHYVSPVVSSILALNRRVNIGLELTFGAITDFRWRTEIQL